MAQSTREWVDFFLGAGIPSEEAASYALIFTRNRIQKNMLVDLNKEYLKDMGITLLGDVIAILKHAKTVDENNSRAWVMCDAKPKTEVREKVIQSSPTLTTTTAAGGSATVKRLLDHYSKKYKEAEEILSGSNNSSQNLVPTKKEKVDLTSSSSKIRLKQPDLTQKLEVPLQKKRKVLPEHEGKYIITMPKKTQIKKEETHSGKTVFSRLGNGSVSSTTGDFPASPVVKMSSSIFARLGDVSSTSTVENKKEDNVVQYAGVLKKTTKPPVPVRKEVNKSKTPATKRTNKSELFREVDLKMLKITTEFSDDDDIEAVTPVSSIAKKIPQQLTVKARGLAKRSRSLESDEEEDEAETSPPKRVRFGGTSFSDSNKPTVKTSFANYSIVKKEIAVGRIDRSASSKIIANSLGSVRSRIGIVKPRPAQPISKMVSDNMVTNSAKKRIDLKAKSNKSGVLARLG